MIPNLSHLAQSKRNVTPSELGHGHSPIPRHRVLASLIIDLVIVALISNIITSFFSLSLGSFFTTPSLHKIWSLMQFNVVNLFTLAAISLSYFHLCYFLNAGQTPGAHFLGIRRKMSHHQMKEAFREALSTIGVYLSFGFTAAKFSHGMAKHDYRYQEFLGLREMQAPNLVRAIEISNASEEDIYEKEAA
jgi:hypothetical protein